MAYSLVVVVDSLKVTAANQKLKKVALSCYCLVVVDSLKTSLASQKLRELALSNVLLVNDTQSAGKLSLPLQ